MCLLHLENYAREFLKSILTSASSQNLIKGYCQCVIVSTKLAKLFRKLLIFSIIIFVRW